jgi:hypothetical protein
MSIKLKKNGVTKKVSTGFSWKLFLFGILYPLATGDNNGAWKLFWIGFLTFGLNYIIAPFTYNKNRIKRLLEDGYEPCELSDETYLVNNLEYKV